MNSHDPPQPPSLTRKQPRPQAFRHAGRRGEDVTAKAMSLFSAAAGRVPIDGRNMDLVLQICERYLSFFGARGGDGRIRGRTDRPARRTL